MEILREGMPARIDRSVWGPRLSGSSGIQLMTALKVLELIDDDGRPGPELERLVKADGDERRGVLSTLLRRHYRPVFELDLARATRAQFREAFRGFGARDGVLAKCEAFFIQAAQDAGMELSSYILQGRHLSRRASARVRPPPAERAVAQPSAPGATPATSVAEMVLQKYPDFDPAWDAAVQEKWLEGMSRLWDVLQSGTEQPAAPRPSDRDP